MGIFLATDVKGKEICERHCSWEIQGRKKNLTSSRQVVTSNDLQTFVSFVEDLKLDLILFYLSKSLIFFVLWPLDIVEAEVIWFLALDYILTRPDLKIRWSNISVFSLKGKRKKWLFSNYLNINATFPIKFDRIFWNAAMERILSILIDMCCMPTDLQMIEVSSTLKCQLEPQSSRMHFCGD